MKKQNPVIKVMESLDVNLVLVGNIIMVSKKLWDNVGDNLHEEFKSLLVEAFAEMNRLHNKFESDSEKPTDEEIEVAVLNDCVFPWLKLNGVEIA